MVDLKSQKITKSTATPSTKKPPPLPNIQEQELCFTTNSMEFTDSFGSDMMQSFDDISQFFEDPMPDMNFDDLLEPAQYQWPWSDTQDWTLMDPTFDDFNSQQMLPQNPELDLVRHQQYTEDSQSSLDMHLEDNGIHANGMLWEHLRTGQLDKDKPRSTLHRRVLEREGPDSYIFDSSDGGSGGSSSSQSPFPDQIGERHNSGPEFARFSDRDNRGNKASLAQMTLRLTGTQKAVKAFGGLLEKRATRARLQNVSIKRIALVALAGLSFSGALRAQAMESIVPGGLATIQPRNLMQPTAEKVDTFANNDRHGEPRPTPLLEGIQIEDHLRMNANQPVLEHSRSSQHSSGGVSQQRHFATLNDDKQTLSLGEGIMTSASPSTELFMLKRRIPKALHSIVAPLDNVKSNGPVLQTISGLQVETLPNLSRMIKGTETTATQVNGGAYLRLENGTPASYIPIRAGVDAGPENLLLRHQPANSGTVIQARHAQISASTDLHANSQPTLSRSNLSGSNCAGVNTELIRPAVNEERLSDHFRRRDHFGRFATAFSPTKVHQIIAKVCAFIMVAVWLRAHTTAATLAPLFLALLSHLSGVEVVPGQFRQNHEPGRRNLQDSSWMRGKLAARDEASWGERLELKDGPRAVVRGDFGFL